jgi:hypothetical protein
LTILAEAFGETLTEERLEIYARELVDLPRELLTTSFRRTLRELKWFPKVAELRELARASEENLKKVQADAAWNYVNEYLRRWGVDRLPVYSSGKKITAPPLDDRTEYALRRIGGFSGLNQIDSNKRPFMYRDFCEAYALAPAAELLAQSLARQFSKHALAGIVSQLKENKIADPPNTTQFDEMAHRPRELTPEVKAELRRKVEEARAKRGE